ncbi:MULTISPECIES: LysR family transcriptional regulator [unclassified Moraxella]|uniref:LysR family transcriptional regulator n=1 Tax=unclassified Moraxella TaxID=2685852 RepID=UPI003AF555C0
MSNTSKNAQSKTPLSQLDLNLLRLFLHIYHSRNLTHTAQELHLSQSAISHALNRLRTALDDELFYREQGQLHPTAYAKRLYPTVQHAFTQLENAFAINESMTDEQLTSLAKQTFGKLTIAMQDEIELIVFAKIFAKLNSELPHCQLTSSRLKRQALGQELKNGTLDFAIDVARAVDKDIHHQPLLHDDFVVAYYQPQFEQRAFDQKQFDRFNPVLDATTYFAQSHITVSSRRLGDSLEDRLLSQAGRQRKVTLRCQHYATACQLLKESPLLLTLPSQLAHAFIPKTADWQVSALPFALPSIALHGYWHASQHDDPLHRWLRERIFAVFL